jgi:hypothetical protein
MSKEILSRIQIHEESEGAKIVSIQGFNNPVVVLDDSLLDKLRVHCEKVKESYLGENELKYKPLVTLCENLGDLLDIYIQITVINIMRILAL